MRQKVNITSKPRGVATMSIGRLFRTVLRLRAKGTIPVFQKPQAKIYCRKMGMRINVCKLTSCSFYTMCQS